MINSIFYLKKGKKAIVFVAKILCFISIISILAVYSSKIHSKTHLSKTDLKILILVSSGKPTLEWKQEVPNLSERVDAITSPTSKYNNTEMIGKKIANSFRNVKLDVTLKKISEIKRADAILFADVILIGSATHYGYMDWQTKRFFDETIYPIYVHRKNKLRDKFIGCFTTTKGGGGERCIESIQNILKDFGSKKLPGLVIYSKETNNDIDKKVKKFVKKVLAKL